jgi:hypothetical protein
VTIYDLFIDAAASMHRFIDVRIDAQIIDPQITR